MTDIINRFENIANSWSLGFRDVVVNEQGSEAKLGRFIISQGAVKNDQTMQAFRDALSRKYGVFGEHAFDTILGARSQLHKSLRVCDIRDTLSSLNKIKENRLKSEINRLMDTDPKMMELPEDVQSEVRLAVKKKIDACKNLGSRISNNADIGKIAQNIIRDSLESVRESHSNSLTGKKNIVTQDLTGRTDTEHEAGSRTPVGLKNLSLIFDGRSTSVEDRIKNGTIGVGERINRSSDNPTLLVKLKTNGVEPGFIYTNDWSQNDTRGLMQDYDSPESREILDDLKKKYPVTASECAKLPLREQIMKFGRAHPACISAVAEFMIEREMKNPESRLYREFCQKFPDCDPGQWQNIPLDSIKKELFAQIRDAVLSVRPEDPDYDKSPMFRHFSDRHIVKLDYNENVRIINKSKASAGKFMRPERIITNRKFGQLYRLQTATTANKSSVGAVTEALANDLSRLSGVPTQELRIVRGRYSDGHPKIMLEAKFAHGYQDLENGFLKDGQIVPPPGKTAEKIGKYKAFFLVSADRDGIGSRGQNKGFADGKFFAIDPGHSLEGNGRHLTVDDNLSFRDTYGYSTKPRFKNFSVFDDDTRFAKFQGVLELRDMKQSQRAEKLFEDYRKAFDPDEMGISAEEKALRKEIISEIDVKQKEFRDNLDKVLSVSENQLRLYDDLAPDGPGIQELAIETIENLEKLTSPTTWISPHGETPLEHLSVIQETRVPWRAHLEGDSIVYHCDRPLSEEGRKYLTIVAQAAGAALEIDAEGCARLTIPKAGAARIMEKFSEKNVSKITHPEEFMARTTGGTGLEEGRVFNREAEAARTEVNQARETASNTLGFNIPDNLEVAVNGKTYRFRKEHYTAMIMDTPPADRPRSIAELRNILAARIGRGQEILKAVYSGQGHRYETSLRNAACVTLAFHAATVEKGEYNERGAFSVEDPDGRIYQWLDKCQEVYLRTSTHARAYHHQQVDGHLNMPRGIDIPRSMGGLMGGMRTFHYFTVPATENEPRRLYLKCETHGIYNSTISDKEVEDSRVSGMQVRKERSGDKSESFLHCLSLVTSITRHGPGEGNRKEDFPASVKTTMERAQKQLRERGFPDYAARLSANVSGKDNGGIRMLLENLGKITGDAMNRNDRTAMAELELITVSLESAIQDYVSEVNAAGVQFRSGASTARLGNEVILNVNEVVPGAPQNPA
ncbi:hypothetical protein [Succinimonas amylolytica]|uniref:hypothetical protein n=1 Tax=Succinimonas amylolytica TaxID=83769 RepID=UPI0023A7F04F